MRRKFRLLKNEDFQRLFKTGHLDKSETYALTYLENNLDHIRVGIAVSKKLGTAVTRNKVKRQIRMICHTHLLLSNPIDIVIVPKSSYLQNTFKENEEKLLTQLTKIGVKINR
jgi:ribonuclease P protein component